MMIRLVALYVVLLAGLPQARAETVTLRYGQIPSTVHGVSSLPRFIAERQGFFARENIALDVVQIPGGTGNMVPALDRGEIDVTQTATPYLVQAALKGSQAVAIAGEIGNPVYSLIAKREIGNFASCRPSSIPSRRGRIRT